MTLGKLVNPHQLNGANNCTYLVWVMMTGSLATKRYSPFPFCELYRYWHEKGWEARSRAWALESSWTWAEPSLRYWLAGTLHKLLNLRPISRYSAKYYTIMHVNCLAHNKPLSECRLPWAGLS